MLKIKLFVLFMFAALAVLFVLAVVKRAAAIAASRQTPRRRRPIRNVTPPNPRD